MWGAHEGHFCSPFHSPPLSLLLPYPWSSALSLRGETILSSASPLFPSLQPPVLSSHMALLPYTHLLQASQQGKD